MDAAPTALPHTPDSSQPSRNFLLGLFRYFPYGGLQKDTLRFALEAKKRGHHVSILTTSWEETPPDGIELIFCQCPARSNYGKMEQFARHFAQLQQTRHFDASLAMNRIPSGDFYFVADTCMKEWFQQKHCWLVRTFFPRYRTYLRHEAEICALSGKTKLLCIAPAQMEAYQKAYGLPPERLIYLPPGMDERCLPPANAEEIRENTRQELQLAPSEFAVIQVGTNLWRKGMDRTMAAVAQLSREGYAIRLILVGGDDSDQILKMAGKCGLSASRILPLGPRKDVPNLLLAADLMIHPAREEGTGTVLIEALAAGCPVICTEECGFSPFIQDATQSTVPAPFAQNTLEKLFREAIQSPEVWREKTKEYAAHQDFCGRSRAAIDLLEAHAAMQASVS